MKMTQPEVVLAILDKKSLDYLNRDGVWEGWCTDGGWDHERLPATLLFSTLALLVRYADCEFRIRPETTIYQTRDYAFLMDSGRKWVISTWTSASGLSQQQTVQVYGSPHKFHWLEETQTREFVAPV